MSQKIILVKLIDTKHYGWEGIPMKTCAIATILGYDIGQNDLDRMLENKKISREEHKAIHRLDNHKGIKNDLNTIKKLAERFGYIVEMI